MQDKFPALLDSKFTNRGFTDPENIDDAQLIHMNGRIYDYNLGRFLSVDPFIQSPGNSQSISPYSYIMNNPLAGTDPSGYIACADVEAGDACDMNSIAIDKVENIKIYQGGSTVVNTTDGKSFLVNNGLHVTLNTKVSGKTDLSEIDSQSQINSEKLLVTGSGLDSIDSSSC